MNGIINSMNIKMKNKKKEKVNTIVCQNCLESFDKQKMYKVQMETLGIEYFGLFCDKCSEGKERIKLYKKPGRPKKIKKENSKKI